MGEFGSTGLQYPTVPIKKIKDTSSSDFHSENSMKKGNKSVIFQCPHVFNNAFSYISPHLSGTSVASGGFCKNILKRISNACPMVLITSYASPPPQSTTKQAVQNKNRKAKINWFSPRWRKLSKTTPYKVKTTPQMETFSKKKNRPDYLGKCTEWDHFKLRYIFIEVKLVSS